MEKINQYLGGLAKFKVKDSDFKEAVVRVIREVVDADIEKNNISISGDVIFISAHSVIKSEIAINQAKILTLLRAQFPKRQIKKII